MSILNKYKRWVPQLIPIKDEYWDFVLSQDDTPSMSFGPRMTKRCLSAYIEFGDKNCQEMNGVHSYPDYTWEQCNNQGALLEDIGYTGIDNGLIYYGGWDKVSNQEFYDIFTNSVIEINSGDCRLHLHQVTGNTGVYSYPMEYVEGKYYTLSGGFFQGFFKLHGFEYQVLPQYIEDEWNVEITLRPRYLFQDEKTLNATHEGNEGIFFFMGARAEDKFLQFYNSDLSKYEERVQPDRKPCDEDYVLIDEHTTWTNEDYDYDKCNKCSPDTGYPTRMKLIVRARRSQSRLKKYRKKQRKVSTSEKQNISHISLAHTDTVNLVIAVVPEKSRLSLSLMKKKIANAARKDFSKMGTSEKTWRINA